MSDWNEYAVLAVAFGVVAFSLFAFASPGFSRQAQSGAVAFSPAGASAGAAAGCGNLQDAGNVQHLSHHPGTYAACLKQVDPAFLKQATGRTLQQILGGA